MESLIGALIAFPLVAWFVSENIYGAVAVVVIELIVFMIFFFKVDKEEKENQKKALEQIKLQEKANQEKQKEYEASIEEHGRLRKEERRLYEGEERDGMWQYYEDRAFKVGPEAFFDMVYSHILGHLSAFDWNKQTIVNLLEEPMDDVACLTVEESKNIYFPSDDKSVEESFSKFFELVLQINPVFSPEKKELLRVLDNTIFSDKFLRSGYIDKDTYDFSLQERMLKEVYNVASKDEKVRTLLSKYGDLKVTAIHKRLKAVETKLIRYASEEKPNYRQPFAGLEMISLGLFELSGEGSKRSFSKSISTVRNAAPEIFSGLAAKAQKKRQLDFDKEADYLEVISMRLSIKEYLDFIQDAEEGEPLPEFALNNTVSSEKGNTASIAKIYELAMKEYEKEFDVRYNGLLKHIEIVRKLIKETMESDMDIGSPPFILFSGQCYFAIIDEQMNIKKLTPFVRVTDKCFDQTNETNFGFPLALMDSGQVEMVFCYPVKKGFKLEDIKDFKNENDQFVKDFLDKNPNCSREEFLVQLSVIMSSKQEMNLNEEAILDDECDVTEQVGDEELIPDLFSGEGDFAVASMNAEKGDIEAQNKLAEMYLVGVGCTKDTAEAIKWFTVAAKQGHVDAQYNLGVLYANGNGVEVDNVMSYALWSLCAGIDEGVVDNLETLTENMSLAEIKKGQKLAETFIG